MPGDRLVPAGELVAGNPARFPNESAEYRKARNALLVEEIELRRHISRVAAQRRALPPDQPDDAERRSTAHVDFEPQQQIADIVGKRLWDDAKAHDHRPIAARGAYALNWSWISIFVDLGKQFAERAGGVDGDCQHPREWPKAERKNEDQRKYQFRHGPEEFKCATGGEVDARVLDEIA